MKCIVTTLMVLAGVSLLAGPCWAETQECGGPGPAKMDEAEMAKRAAERIEKLIESLELTGEKEAKVQEIFKTHRQEMADWRRQNKARREVLRKALKEAREALQNIRGRMRELAVERKQRHEKLLTQLQAELSEEQIAKVKKHFARIWRHRRAGRFPGAHRWAGRFPGTLRKLDLTDEQKEAVKKILGEAKAQAKEAESPKAKAKIMRAARDKIASEVLTAEQREKLAAMPKCCAKGHKGRMFVGLDLTDQQREQIAEIRKDAGEKAKAAETRQEKRKIMRAVREKIVQEILTDEQRKQLREKRGHGQGKPCKWHKGKKEGKKE